MAVAIRDLTMPYEVLGEKMPTYVRTDSWDGCRGQGKTARMDSLTHNLRLISVRPPSWLMLG